MSRTEPFFPFMGYPRLRAGRPSGRAAAVRPGPGGERPPKSLRGKGKRCGNRAPPPLPEIPENRARIRLGFA